MLIEIYKKAALFMQIKTVSFLLLSYFVFVHVIMYFSPSHSNSLFAPATNPTPNLFVLFIALVCLMSQRIYPEPLMCS